MNKTSPIDQCCYAIMIFSQIVSTLVSTRRYFHSGNLGDLCFASLFATFAVIYASRLVKPNA